MSVKILLVIAVILLLLGSYALFVEPRRLREKHFLIRKNKSKILDISAAYDLFENEEDLIIAHLSDLHFSRFYPPKRINRLLRKVREAQPDLIVFTGDLIDDYKNWPPKLSASLISKLKNLQAPMGKIAVLGNHDYRSDGAYFVQEILEAAGFTVLINDEIFGADDKVSLSIAGIADPSSEKSQFFYESTMAKWQILLLHQPDYINRVKNLADYDLVLSGHSHGGQIRLANFFPKTPGAKIFTDRFYLPTENTLLSVNTGIGMTGLPVRFGVPPEVDFYHLSPLKEPFREISKPFDLQTYLQTETPATNKTEDTEEKATPPLQNPLKEKLVEVFPILRRYKASRTVS